MRFSVLGSGSGGNVSYVETRETRILVDAGLSCREIERRLGLLELEPTDVDGIVVTHEHIDHVRGVGVFARRYQVPVLINRATFSRCSGSIGNIPTPVFFNTGETLTFKDVEIHFISKCHDAADPVALTLSCDGYKLGLVTDLGRPTSLVLDSIQGCDALVLEFNHDTEMLELGPYPLELKRRIRGPDGHLSNEQAAQILEMVAHEHLELIVLAHLSEVNNREQLAYREAKRIVEKACPRGPSIIVSTQNDPIPLVHIGAKAEGVSR